MNVLLINSVCGIGSTGKICGQIAENLTKEGHRVKIAYGRDSFVPERYRSFAHRIGTDISVRLHGLNSRIFDCHGFASAVATRRFLAWAEEFDPQLLWLHNLHGYYLHVGLLFDWIKSRPRMEVRWTLHDCWAFTGHCAYFDMIGCEKWKDGCGNCPGKGSYPASLLLDRSHENYLRKQQAFTGVANMTLIAPSNWLADLARQSFLKEYPVLVHRNTIDRTVFKPTHGDFRERHGLAGKKIILGVASVWSRKKGLEDFRKLAGHIDDKTAIVLVGLTDQQKKTMPENILALGKTRDQRHLAEIYTAADVLFNPTYEDNYPTVNLEAESCGTKVVTYCTGGAPETISLPESAVIPVGDYMGVLGFI